MSGDTIFALSSGRPPAAISVIRISGPQAHDAGTALAGKLPEPRVAAVRELRHPQTGDLLDQALILRFDGPASSTGENVVEIQCHGGRAVVDALLGAVGDLNGLRPAEPGEFTRRAFENGRIDLTEAEGFADLIEAETEVQRKAALAVAEGGLRQAIADWQERLLGLSAQAERMIEYEEDDQAIDATLLRGCEELADELRVWLARPRAELLKDGVLVVVAGPPNSGKSSLINAIAGEERVIVTDVPGTTRDYVEVPLALDGIPIRLTDTAGLRDSHDRVEAIGIERARRLVDQADILVWLGDGPAPTTGAEIIVVHSKSDLPDRWDVPIGRLAVSVISGVGLPEVGREIATKAKQILPGNDAIALNRRQATELSVAQRSLERASALRDALLLAEELRSARLAFDRMTGRAGFEDMLDSLFGHFCLGK